MKRENSNPTAARASSRKRARQAESSASCDDWSLLTIPTPPGFSLAQAICSYGYFGLAPNVWRAAHHGSSGVDEAPEGGVYSRPLRYGEKCKRVVKVRVAQDAVTGALRVTLDREVRDAEHRAQLCDKVRRITRLDFDLTEFHRLHPTAAARGFGRLFRSPTLFEDMVKTLTNCNMRWNGTVQMNKLLCSKLGSPEGAFPTPHEVAAATMEDLGSCRLGYRASYVHSLARRFVHGEIDHGWLESTDRTSGEIMSTIKKLSGFGPFAAANCCQLLGHYDVVAYDTETRRLWHESHNSPETKGSPSKQLIKRAEKHYGQFAPFQFIAYWFELWQNYERSKGLRSTLWSTMDAEEL